MGKRTRYSLPVALAAVAIMIIASVSWADQKHDHGKEQSQSTGDFFNGASKQNGFSIYYDGMTLKGERIEIEGGPHWLYMHGGGCASCHGDKGQGGFTPMMCNKKTPPISFKALMSDEHKHDGIETGHAPYTIDKIKRALEFSINPALKPLDPCMPKWFLKDDDFRDLLFYMQDMDQ